MHENYNKSKIRTLSQKARYGDLLAIYGAFALIAAIVFGTAFSRTF